jgi:hypothetical protein
VGLGCRVPRSDIVASGHGLRCEDGCCDQRDRYESHFAHLFLHLMSEAKEALGSVL